jgi:hypothetical protein
MQKSRTAVDAYVPGWQVPRGLQFKQNGFENVESASRTHDVSGPDLLHVVLVDVYVDML